MVDLLVSNQFDKIQIQSYKGIYEVHFIEDAFAQLNELLDKHLFLIVDKNVSQLYQKQLHPFLEKFPHKIIEATEENKDLTQFTSYASDLVKLGLKRNVTIVAIGGGIIQDISCFLAATLFRGLDWIFFPTTLLAQADSCIGSKSSINVGGIKNLMGTFTPPQKIFISTAFLKTLEQKDIFSGIGEMIKVHGIAGIQKLKEFAKDYPTLLKDNAVFNKYLVQSLNIKKEIIEKDEFDTGPRLVMNYGHTFGHAVESASNYKIPHGIAITIGQSMACDYSFQNKYISDSIQSLAQNLLLQNISTFKNAEIDFNIFWNSIQKDKKNVASSVALILPKNDSFKIEKQLVEANSNFQNFCRNFFIKQGYNVIN